MKKTIAFLLILSSCFFVFSLSLDENGVNSFDFKFAKRYSAKLDKTGTALTLTSVAGPAVLLSSDSKSNVTIGTMYLETMALTYGTKELLKHVIDRNRPYTYFDTAPEKDKDEWNQSFPSGHTAAAFASAAFTSYVFCKCYPDSDWKIPVVLTCSALAVTTAVLRVESGNHFPTDVLASAALGTLIGIGIPALHNVNSNDSKIPFSLAFSFGF